MSQGYIANLHGNILEQQVVSAFCAHGFTPITHVDFQRVPQRQGDFLVRNVPYQSIYGHQGKTEFVASSSGRNMQMRIECKWQQSAGSVDEKFPYLYLNCVENMPENEILILIDGNGYKPGALAWLQNAAQNHLYMTTPKQIHVMGLSQFLGWINRRLTSYVPTW